MEASHELHVQLFVLSANTMSPVPLRANFLEQLRHYKLHENYYSCNQLQSGFLSPMKLLLTC
jgi:hypothetical protein